MTTSHQFINNYLNQKRSLLSTEAAGIDAAASVALSHCCCSCPHHGVSGAAPLVRVSAAPFVAPQVDTVLNGTSDIQQFVDRTESLASRVTAYEEKIVNLTKLVKLSASIQDERIEDLKRQNTELKGRLRRQEAITYRLEQELMVDTAGSSSNGPMSLRQHLKAATERCDVLAIRLEAVEKRCESIDHALADLIDAYKESTTTSANQHADLVQLHHENDKRIQELQTSSVEELKALKEWATRNLARLKKHVDAANDDLCSLRESQVQTNTELQRIQAQADTEHEKLLALLQQKAREANILTEIVDKEIQSIHNITTQHRNGLGKAISAEIAYPANIPITTINKFMTDNGTIDTCKSANMFAEGASK